MTAVDDTNGTWQYHDQRRHELDRIPAVTTDVGVAAHLKLANPRPLRAEYEFLRHGFARNHLSRLGPNQRHGRQHGRRHVDGGTTAFSTASASAAIVVEAPPTITGAGTSTINDSNRRSRSRA